MNPCAAVTIPLAIVLLISIPSAAHAGLEPTLCFEDVDDLCGIGSGDPVEVFSGILQPLEDQLNVTAASGFGFLIFWAGILAIIWFKTENIMILGITGIMINATIVGFNPEAQGLGLLLLGVANGLLLFQLLRQRVSLFS